MSVILALWKLRWENYHEFKASVCLQSYRMDGIGYLWCVTLSFKKICFHRGKGVGGGSVGKGAFCTSMRA